MNIQKSSHVVNLNLSLVFLRRGHVTNALHTDAYIFAFFFLFSKFRDKITPSYFAATSIDNRSIPSALLSAIIISRAIPSSRRNCHNLDSTRAMQFHDWEGGRVGDWGLSCIRLYRAIAIYMHMNSLLPAMPRYTSPKDSLSLPLDSQFSLLAAQKPN